MKKIIRFLSFHFSFLAEVSAIREEGAIVNGSKLKGREREKEIMEMRDREEEDLSKRGREREGIEGSLKTGAGEDLRKEGETRN